MKFLDYLIDYFPGLRGIVTNIHTDWRAIIFTIFAVVIIYLTSVYAGIPIALWFCVFILASIFTGIGELKERNNKIDKKLDKILNKMNDSK